MGQVVPNAIEVEVINQVLTPNLTMRLYGNNHTPVQTDSAAAYTEISGGGYAAKPLTFANWVIASGDPSRGTYNAIQTFNFTGPINAPGTIYGYFVTRDSDGHLMWAQIFPPANIPFSPIAGSSIQITPTFSSQSEF